MTVLPQKANFLYYQVILVLYKSSSVISFVIKNTAQEFCFS